MFNPQDHHENTRRVEEQWRKIRGDGRGGKYGI
jgi:hypothetical protein